MAKRVAMEKHLECHDYGRHSILMNTAHSGHLMRGDHGMLPLCDASPGLEQLILERSFKFKRILPVRAPGRSDS